MGTIKKRTNENAPADEKGRTQNVAGWENTGQSNINNLANASREQKDAFNTVETWLTQLGLSVVPKSVSINTAIDASYDNENEIIFYIDGTKRKSLACAIFKDGFNYKNGIFFFDYYDRKTTQWIKDKNGVEEFKKFLIDCKAIDNNQQNQVEQQPQQNQNVAESKGIKKESNSLNKEPQMEEAKLRKLIQEKVFEFLTQKKVVSEAKEKEGHGKPTSGLKKETVGTTHTEKTKSKNPPAKKVTDGGPENKTLATAEATKIESETKEMKQPDNTEFTDRGKYVKEGSGFKTECMGIELDVKGRSYADINSLYLLAQMRKALEGRGEFIRKVTVEMGEKKTEKDTVKESVEIQNLRKKIKSIIKEQLEKKLK